MPRLRVARNFNQRTISSETIEPVRKFFFAFEGSRTEPDYFKGLEKFRYALDFHKLIELIRLERAADDGKSHPKHILKGAIELLDSGDHTYDHQLDELWLIFDRDEQSVSTEQLNDIISKCECRNYKIALSNPNFEFWLLCHFEDVNTLPPEELFKNRRISKKHTFISKKLTKIIPHGYNKNKLRFHDFKDKIDIAVSNSKKFTTDIEGLKTTVGTNMGLLIEELRKD